MSWVLDFFKSIYTMSDTRVKCNKLQDLLRQDCNQKCADCGNPIHRKLGTDITTVKNVGLDDWEEGEAENMGGNEVARCIYERFVPVWYRKMIFHGPNPDILREHWIRAKYEQKAFSTQNFQFVWACRNFSVQLKKKSKDDNTYKDKLVTVSDWSKTLGYNIDGTNSCSRCTFSVSDIEVALAPKSMQHSFSMQISVCSPITTRHIYLKDDSPQKIMNLYMAIRRCKYLYLEIAFPDWQTHKILLRLPRDFTMEGWLWKRGSHSSTKYKKRWVTIMKRRITYHKEDLDPTPRGYFTLASNQDNHAVAVFTDEDTPGREFFPFVIHTPSEVYSFAATSYNDQQKWIQKINWTVSSNEL